MGCVSEPTLIKYLGYLSGMKDTIEVEGRVTEVLPNTLFRVSIEIAPDLPELVGRIILAHISGKMRRYFIRMMVGDRVRVEMSPKYDLDKGRITYRLK